MVEFFVDNVVGDPMIIQPWRSAFAVYTPVDHLLD
jgi:hypothetical protein